MIKIEPKEIGYILMGLLTILIIFKKWQNRRKKSNIDNTKLTSLHQSIETIKPDLISRLARTNTKLASWLDALLGFLIISIVIIGAIYDPLIRYILFITIGIMILVFFAYKLIKKI